MLNVVILPEYFEPIFWPNTFQQCTSVKQTKILNISLENCAITFDPTKLNDELEITDLNKNKQEYHTIAKYSNYMKDYFVYACSIQIKAKTINNLKTIVLHSYREVYIPAIDTINPQIFNFICQDLQEIKITRHIQFTPHTLYKEIFENNLHQNKFIQDKDQINEGFSYYINKFKYAS